MSGALDQGLSSFQALEWTPILDEACYAKHRTKAGVGRRKLTVLKPRPLVDIDQLRHAAVVANRHQQGKFA